VPDVAADLERSAKAVGSMLLNYGFSAKKTSGWGVTSDDVNGMLTANGAFWPLPAGPEKKAVFEDPKELFLKFMTESGEANPLLIGVDGKLLQNEPFKVAGSSIGSLSEYKKFRDWYNRHGEEWKRRKKGSAGPVATLRQYPFATITDLASLAGSLAVELRKAADV
jgi:CRISPR-associated protein Cmr2